MMYLEKHNEHCKKIADRLEAYASGDYFLYGGELYPLDSEDYFWNVSENYSYYLADDGYYYYNIEGEEIWENDVEPASIYGYMENVLDVTYTLDSNFDLNGVKLMVACGGPNIYIDTVAQEVRLNWWGEHGICYLDGGVCDEIDDYFREYLECSGIQKRR